MDDLDKKMRELAARMAQNPPAAFTDEDEYEDDEPGNLNEPLWLYYGSRL